MSADTPNTAGDGLARVVAGKQSISAIDGTAGTLRYCGYDIHELAPHSSFEETTWLLWQGDLPGRGQLADFTTLLASQRSVPPAILNALQEAPTGVSLMGLLRTAVSSLGQHDPEAEAMSLAANRRKAARLTAQMATLVAAIDRASRGLDAVAPDPALGHAANFLYMLRGARAAADEVRAVDAALVLHADHGFNASTFAARVTAATLADMHSAITSAVGTLKGPLHGGANQRVMQMLLEIGTADRVDAWVRARLAAGERIFGFGHRVYKVEDPRGRHLRAHAEALARRGEPELLAISRRLVDAVAAHKGLHINVDFWSASLYSFLGLRAELFPLMFAMSRIAGWTAHVIEQYADNKLIRPRAEYVGAAPRPYRPLSER